MVIRIAAIYPSRMFYYGLSAAALLFVASYRLSWLFPLAQTSLFLTVSWFFISVVILFIKRNALLANRRMEDVLGLGDDNDVMIYLESRYPLSVSLQITDELPFQFQHRSFRLKTSLRAGANQMVIYRVKPLTRGEYHFGNLIVMVSFAGSFAMRRYAFPEDHTVRVFPSVKQMKVFQLKVLNRLSRMEGQKKFRKLGQSYEFEQIRNYSEGDDFRHINWKATGRTPDAIKVNQYEDERSQAVYCLIDKSRNMSLPFDGMTLLDHAVNSSLVLSNSALLKGDKAGLITCSRQVDTFIRAGNQPGQLRKILHALYREGPGVQETDFEAMYAAVSFNIRQRSLLVLFTNFETTHNLYRVLPILRKLNRRHLLLVVFFENSEIATLAQKTPISMEDAYTHVIAEKLLYQKSLIVTELRLNGIRSLMTPPEDLSMMVLNQYLDIKSLGLL